MSHDLPDDWYEEHDGQRLVLSAEKVAASIAAAVAEERKRCAVVAKEYMERCDLEGALSVASAILGDGQSAPDKKIAAATPKDHGS